MVVVLEVSPEANPKKGALRRKKRNTAPNAAVFADVSGWERPRAWCGPLDRLLSQSCALSRLA